jgi:dCTP deaminase
MILSGRKIEAEVHAVRIVIDPFDPSCCNPNSYNYHLGETIVALSAEGTPSPPTIIPLDGFRLEPGRVYLGHTKERIGSTEHVVSLIGKSSIGRLGLFLQISADLGHQNEIHKWTLELTCVRPFRIYPAMVIGQVTFWRTSGRPYQSTGRYGRFDPPTPRLEP